MKPGKNKFVLRKTIQERVNEGSRVGNLTQVFFFIVSGINFFGLLVVAYVQIKSIVGRLCPSVRPFVRISSVVEPL